MRVGTKSRLGRPSPSMVVAVIALILSLTGSAVAFQLGKNSVGTRQLKSKAVTTGKIGNNAVNGAKVANHSLSSSDITFSASDIVPNAANANHAVIADSVAGHAASCPEGTTLIRGTCFDSASNPPVNSVTAAEDACVARGGYLPSVLQLYGTRSVLNLGTGVGDDHQYTDSYYSRPGEGNYRTLVVDGTGAIYELEVTAPSRYICAYNLLQ